jgi:hypothetical protein
LILAWLGLGYDASLPGLVAALMEVGVLGVIVWQALINRKIVMTELRIGPGEVNRLQKLELSVTQLIYARHLRSPAIY